MEHRKCMIYANEKTYSITFIQYIAVHIVMWLRQYSLDNRCSHGSSTNDFWIRCDGKLDGIIFLLSTPIMTYVNEKRIVLRLFNACIVVFV